MLKIKTDHFFGSQERYDLQLVRMTLDTTDLNEKEAVENGWLIANDEWYNCRSTRLNIKEYLSKTKRPKEYNSLSYTFLWNSQIDDDIKSEIKRVYDEFVQVKGFDAEYNLFCDTDRSAWIVVLDEGKMVAFTKFIMYQNATESQFTAWNYHKPKLSVGKNIIWYEVISAESLLFCEDYLYIGQGYEAGSLYKADLPGFEWWTGEEWSKDVEEYKRLCTRDGSINTLSDLTKVYKNAPR